MQVREILPVVVGWAIVAALAAGLTSMFLLLIRVLRIAIHGEG